MSIYIRYADLRKGDIIHSTHGYRLLITEVNDPAKATRDPNRHVEIKGHMHADPLLDIVTERHSAALPARIDDLESDWSEEA